MEDQFVVFKPDRTINVDCPCPQVIEQYVCHYAMEGHTANWIRALTALHRATGEKEYLAKATALADHFEEGILHGVDILGLQPGRKALVVFTDGEHQGSHVTFDEVEQLLQSSDLILYMIGQGRGVTSQPLQKVMDRLSRPTGGRALSTNSIDELQDSFNALLEELSNQYVLGYQPTNAARDDTWREIKVDVAGHSRIRARHAIIATPQFIAARLVGRPCDFTYGSWMVANLTLRDRPTSAGFPLAWDNVLYESPSLGYVVSTHQRGIDHGPTVLTYYYPLTTPNARETLLATGRDEWAGVALADLSRAHPEIRSRTERIDVMRWGHAMIRPRPNFVWSPARTRAASPHGNIHFANTDLSGIALFEEALYHGVRAAEEVMGEGGGRWL